MGFKTSLLVYTSGEPAHLLRTPLPPPDPARTSALVAATHPEWTATSGTADGTLSDDIYPSEGSVYAGSFPGIDVLCDRVRCHPGEPDHPGGHRRVRQDPHANSLSPRPGRLADPGHRLSQAI
jgi:hypothetical protein